jgi:hypothetical protein
MGLENTGVAITNGALFWIDCDALADAVDLFMAAGVDVSIYNLPLCVLDRTGSIIFST